MLKNLPWVFFVFVLQTSIQMWISTKEDEQHCWFKDLLLEYNQCQMLSSLLTDALSKVFGEACETDALEAAQGVLTLPFTLPVFTFILVCTHNTAMLVLSRSVHTTQTCLYCQGLNTQHRHAYTVKVCTHNTAMLVLSRSAHTTQTRLYCQGLHTQYRHVCIDKVSTHNTDMLVKFCTHNTDMLVL